MAEKGTNVPEDLLYTETHEWLRITGEKSGICGITDHAQNAMGDIVFVEFTAGIVNSRVDAGGTAAIIESPKAASDVYSPAAGTISGINSNLEEFPEIINKDPYGEGWLFKIEIENMDGLNSLMKPAAYRKHIAGDE